jgi:hypothetical protein
MREIPLTKGKVTIVDDADYEGLTQRRWHLLTPKRGGEYAMSSNGTGMHRAITSAPPGMEVDHINGNGLDNRRGNLRVCTKSGNQRNQRVQSRAKTSVFKGVSRMRGRTRWVACIKLGGRDTRLGSFGNEVDAALAYDAAARKHFGEFARTNFIEV